MEKLTPNEGQPTRPKFGWRAGVFSLIGAIIAGAGIVVALQPSDETASLVQSAGNSGSTTTTTRRPISTLASPPVSESSASSPSDFLRASVPSPPSVSISCPSMTTSGASTAATSFGHQVTPGTSPLARWAIDYGDGKNYETHHGPGAESAVFAHTYTESGSYIVEVTVTDQNGLSDYDNCVFTWFKPYVATIPNLPATPPSYSIPDYELPDYDLPDYDFPDDSDPYPPGGYNDTGCPRDQWVNGYFRKDGTYVDGYFRNSPTDGCGGG